MDVRQKDNDRPTPCILYMWYHEHIDIDPEAMASIHSLPTKRRVNESTAAFIFIFGRISPRLLETYMQSVSGPFYYDVFIGHCNVVQPLDVERKLKERVRPVASAWLNTTKNTNRLEYRAPTKRSQQTLYSLRSPRITNFGENITQVYKKSHRSKFVLMLILAPHIRNGELFSHYHVQQ